MQNGSVCIYSFPFLKRLQIYINLISKANYDIPPIFNTKHHHSHSFLVGTQDLMFIYWWRDTRLTGKTE